MANHMSGARLRARTAISYHIGNAKKIKTDRVKVQQ
jgi:hypothetical protein